MAFVSEALINEIDRWIREECTIEDVVIRLRSKTVPNGYSPQPWISGEDMYVYIRRYITFYMYNS